MLDDTEYSPCGNPKLSIILDKMGVNPYRGGSYFDANPERPQDGKRLSLDSLFTKNITGVLHNVPLTEAQLGAFMEALQDQDISHLDLASNSFDDSALRVILNNLPQTVKILELTNNNFTTDSVSLLEEFNATHPECEVSTNEYAYTCIQFVDTEECSMLLGSSGSDGYYSPMELELTP